MRHIISLRLATDCSLQNTRPHAPVSVFQGPETRELSRCQLCRHWWHRRLIAVPPATTELAPWQLPLFSYTSSQQHNLFHIDRFVQRSVTLLLMFITLKPIDIPRWRHPGNGNIFRVTGPLCGEFTGHRWIPLPKSQWRGALKLMFSLICAWTNG